ncbi:LON peptidase substrate-binding domain-containing protein [Chloroflexus sp.]|uniref:LON peptidase substrate-binding domain-containing protein n=1 Tax=Chloroflexus sp. TaxID=1904827 RepID=UPI0026269361|nr:LON peptidase substrate-binding domain-containing protein [uncultured Chloroflexus sp.]
MEQTLTLPLFPLGSLLFPGGDMNLHIFEERYRLMIGRCLSTQQPFGIVLLRRGHEVIEGRRMAIAPEPYDVGTIALIQEHIRLEDGRYLLHVVGQKRFRIATITEKTPYLVAQVKLLPDRVDEQTLAAATELRDTYRRYWERVATITGVEIDVEELPLEPIRLSYALADRLQIDPAQKQRWLEADVTGRLRGLIKALRTELAILPRGPQGFDPQSMFGGWNSLN